MYKIWKAPEQILRNTSQYILCGLIIPVLSYILFFIFNDVHVHHSHHIPWRHAVLYEDIIVQYITYCIVKLWMYKWMVHCTIYDKCYGYGISAHCEMNRLRAFAHCEMNGFRVNVLLRIVDAYHRRLESLSFSLLDTVLIDTGSIFPC